MFSETCQTLHMAKNPGIVTGNPSYDPNLPLLLPPPQVTPNFSGRHSRPEYCLPAQFPSEGNQHFPECTQLSFTFKHSAHTGTRAHDNFTLLIVRAGNTSNPALFLQGPRHHMDRVMTTEALGHPPLTYIDYKSVSTVTGTWRQATMVELNRLWSPLYLCPPLEQELTLSKL